MTDTIPTTSPHTAIKPAPKYGRISLLIGIAALLLSQATLYLFIFTAVLAPLTATSIVLLSLGAGLTLFSAGLAIITGHRTLHDKLTQATTRQGTLGLIFGYGTLLILIITVVVGIMNSASLQETVAPPLHCVQTGTTAVCSTE